MAKNITLVQMINGQIQTGRKVIGLIAECKARNNKKFSLTKVDAESGVYEFTEIVDETNETEVPTIVPEVISITKANQAVMRYLYNPNEKPAPEAELIEENGKKLLVIGDRKISCGTLPLLKVLGGVEDTVILTAKGADDTVVDIMAYKVQMDTFVTVERGLGKDIELVKAGEMTLLIDNIIEDVILKDDKGDVIVDGNGDPVTKPAFKSATLYQYMTSSYDSIRVVNRYDEDDDDWNDDVSVDFCRPIESIRLISQGTRQDLVVVFNKETDDNGYLVDSEKATIMLFAVSNGVNIGDCVGIYKVSDPKAKVYLGGSFRKAPIVTIVDTDAIIIRDTYGLNKIDDATVVAALDGYTEFCGTEVTKDDDGRNVVTFTYANKDMNVKSFSMVNTDRGLLWSLVD